ncbi:hypothetical protein MANES_02G142350v8 [Manihot esculenta]|uniref:Uncharacterized protein n=1 Tax=Manihot esculenta TaxID=3983 RepID=A0ACB7I5H2_MANES|nr:hypothetical protein MANES_02G142350v8 [Manihot esculenta]
MLALTLLYFCLMLVLVVCIFSEFENAKEEKINLISCGPLAHVSDIKLIRTDTTLDLSQKAEKGMLCIVFQPSFYRAFTFLSPLPCVDVGYVLCISSIL